MTVKILAIAGSSRKGSLNTRLAKAFVATAKGQGAEAAHLDIRSFDLPLYCGDLENDEKIMGRVKELGGLINEYQGIFLACPEYNGAITPLLKNTLDWVSRIKEGTPPKSPWAGKTYAIGATSMGVMGGLRGLTAMCGLMTAGYQGHVIPQTIAVPQGHERLDEDGEVMDDKTKAMLEMVAKSLIEAAG